MIRNLAWLLGVVCGGCVPCAPLPPAPVDAGPVGSLGVENATSAPVTVYVAFGSDSVVQAGSWPICGVDAGLNCTFTVPANTTLPLPSTGQYLNATMSFGGPVACGRTKVELNLHNPSWYDVVDVSLVDGFSSSVSLTYGSLEIGPVTSAAGNDKALGVYPLGCDLCVARSSQTPCGMAPGTDGCKAGSQYDPTVPCQYQGSVKDGAASVVVTYLGG